MAEMPLNDSRHPTQREPDSQVGTLELDEVDDVPPEGRRCSSPRRGRVDSRRNFVDL